MNLIRSTSANEFRHNYANEEVHFTRGDLMILLAQSDVETRLLILRVRVELDFQEGRGGAK